jgi:hypothetical protein
MDHKEVCKTIADQLKRVGTGNYFFKYGPVAGLWVGW